MRHKNSCNFLKTTDIGYEQQRAFLAPVKNMGFIKNFNNIWNSAWRIFFSALLLALLVATSSLSPRNRRDPRGDFTAKQLSRYTKVELRSEKTYYQIGERIPIHFRVENTGYQILRIYPSSDVLKSFRFLVLDEAGREVPARLFAGDFSKGPPKVVNLTGNPVKEIILAPGEVFEKTIYLSKFYSLEAGKSYRIKGYFWPDARFSEIFLHSTNLLRIRIAAKKENKTEHSHLYAQKADGPILSPEETVYLFLSAEMRRNWKNYLKFLDLPKFITAYDRYAARYVQASAQEKRQVLAEFRQYLISEPSDRLQKFRILGAGPEGKAGGGTAFQPRRYVVRVSALRSASGFSSRYEYTYTLETKHRRGNTYWQIIYVEAILKSSGGN